MGQQGPHLRRRFEGVRVPAEPAGGGGPGVQDRHAGARPRGCTSRRSASGSRAASGRLRRLCLRAAAVRPADRGLPADPGDDRRFQKTEAMAAKALTLETPAKRDARRKRHPGAAGGQVFASEMWWGGLPTGRCRSRRAGLRRHHGIERLLPRRAHLPHLRGFDQTSNSSSPARLSGG